MYVLSTYRCNISLRCLHKTTEKQEGAVASWAFAVEPRLLLLLSGLPGSSVRIRPTQASREKDPTSTWTGVKSQPSEWATSAILVMAFGPSPILAPPRRQPPANVGKNLPGHPLFRVGVPSNRASVRKHRETSGYGAVGSSEPFHAEQKQQRRWTQGRSRDRSSDNLVYWAQARFHASARRTGWMDGTADRL